MRKFTGDQLVVATHNKGKLEEISALLAPYGVKITSNDDHGLPEPVEDGVTFIDNARIKAHAAAKATGLPTLADDSGLSVDALDGAPGIYTADWAETLQGRDFPMAMKKVEDALPVDASRKAQFNCTLVLAWPDGHYEVFAGILHGALVWPMRGENGHGYDPVFQPDGFEQTCGEMDRWEKNKISHRADAFNKLVTGCFD
jgi:XTP/dITP diphosphohydrolase